MHKGKRTEEGLRENIRVGVQYIEAWLRGRGAVPIYNLMEDAATAEISRAQVWQWIHLKAKLDDGREATPDMFRDGARRRDGAGQAARSASRPTRAAASRRRSSCSPTCRLRQRSRSS